MTITPMQPYGRVSIIVYLVVVDIRIVDCHMYPGGCLTPQVMYSHIYRPSPQCNTSINYTNPIILQSEKIMLEIYKSIQKANEKYTN